MTYRVIKELVFDGPQEGGYYLVGFDQLCQPCQDARLRWRFTSAGKISNPPEACEDCVTKSKARAFIAAAQGKT